MKRLRTFWLKPLSAGALASVASGNAHGRAVFSLAWWGPAFQGCGSAQIDRRFIASGIQPPPAE
ncbi:hypothetical protein Q31a_10970 [Aureliella helgolandensis]|uniref:Uncharacterized protein n=1 Tax=Aureliella helgolandensis TaxID=2527968 RepID=A0A518G2H1_9BACT|nr:hypothetical protein Q31a_10970 [Aureliella helgolandensis]